MFKTLLYYTTENHTGFLKPVCHGNPTSKRDNISSSTKSFHKGIQSAKDLEIQI